MNNSDANVGFDPERDTALANHHTHVVCLNNHGHPKRFKGFLYASGIGRGSPAGGLAENP